MEKIKNLQREKLVMLIANHIKGTFKQMGKKTNCELDIELSNWSCGFGRNSKWAYSEIKFGGNSYTYDDKEIDDAAFIRMLNDAVAFPTSGAKCIAKPMAMAIGHPKKFALRELRFMPNHARSSSAYINY